MAQEKHIWFNGSYRPHSKKLGVAWTTRVQGEYVSDSREVTNTLEDDQAHGAQYADLVACFHALKSLEAGPVIVAHTNSTDLIHCMETGKLNPKRAGIAPLAQAFEFAMKQTARLKTVRFERTADKNNEAMQLVDQLARTASTPTAEEVKKPDAHQDSKRPARPANPRR